VAARLVGKELDDEAGFEVGALVRRVSRLLSEAEFAEVALLWESLRFWSMPAQGETDVLDGTTYLLEAAEHGRYWIAHRDDPEWGDTLGEFGDLLQRLATFALR
jgi:hypothetical protein